MDAERRSSTSSRRRGGGGGEGRGGPGGRVGGGSLESVISPWKSDWATFLPRSLDEEHPGSPCGKLITLIL